MRANPITFHLASRRLPGLRAARRGVTTVVLTAVMTTGTSARAGNDQATSVEDDALARIATDALSQGVAGPGPWEQRAMLVGFGVAGLYLGPGTGPSARDPSSNALGSAVHRLVLPLAGAALGSLAACQGMCSSHDATSAPLVGSVAGALVAHALIPSPRHRNRASRQVAWTPVVAIDPGSYSVAVVGRF